jgi:hypothetical protein
LKHESGRSQIFTRFLFDTIPVKEETMVKLAPMQQEDLFHRTRHCEYAEDTSERKLVRGRIWKIQKRTSATLTGWWNPESVLFSIMDESDHMLDIVG